MTPPLLILPQSLMESGYCPFTQRSLTRHSGPPTYFTQLRIRRVLLLLHHQAQHSLLQQAGFAIMAQKVLLNINLQLSAWHVAIPIFIFHIKYTDILVQKLW